MEKYVKPWIACLDVYKPGKTIEGKIKLSSNENNYGPSPMVVSALKDWAPKVNMYPYLFNEVNEAIAEFCGVKPENIVCGNGSDEIIDFIAKIFKGPFAGFYPSFSEYVLCSKANGEEYVDSILDEGFVFDADRFIEDTKSANIIFLCNPNNPTGGVLERKDIIKVLDTGKITIVDEAYAEFTGETVVDLIEDYENLIVLRTFAKSFGIAGLRVGYSIACEKMTEILGKVRPPFNVNLFAQVAALAALDDQDYMRKTVDVIKKDRDKLSKALDKKYNAFPSEANFVLADVSPQMASEAYQDLFNAGFIVREFGKFKGFKGEYIRVTVGTTQENNAFIKALEDI